jgi:hypothetical protein
LSGDAGSADPRLVAALASEDRAQLLAALVDARVFAGISATSTAEHGLRAESSAEMAVLLLEVDGRRALPVFSDVVGLRRWNLAARPVPLTGAQACQAALDEGAGSVVLNSSVVLDAAEVAALAAGWVPVPGSTLASRHQQVQLTAPVSVVPAGLVEALRRALRQEPVVAARLLDGPDGLVLGICTRSPLEPSALAALAQRLMTRLGDALPPAGLDLAQVGARGPGVPVIKRRSFLPLLGRESG